MFSIFNPTSKGNAFSTSFYLLNGSRQTLVILRYYGLERLPLIVSFNRYPPLVRLHSFLVRKVLLLPVTTFQDYYHFKPCLNIKNTVKITISRLKYIRYICILTKKIKNHTWIHYTQRAQAKTMPSVHTSSQFYIPSGQFPVSNCNFNGHVALHAHVNSVTPDLR